MTGQKGNVCVSVSGHGHQEIWYFWRRKAQLKQGKNKSMKPLPIRTIDKTHVFPSFVLLIPFGRVAH